VSPGLCPGFELLGQLTRRLDGLVPNCSRPNSGRSQYLLINPVVDQPDDLPGCPGNQDAFRDQPPRVAAGLFDCIEDFGVAGQRLRTGVR
jgi:hypothetical protein